MRFLTSVVLATAGLTRPAGAGATVDPLRQFGSPLAGRVVGRAHAQRQAPDLVALALAAREVRARARAGTPETLRSLAWLEVLEGHPDTAANTLRRVLAQAPGDARGWSDLAAYEIEAARLDPADVRALALALDAAATARALDPQAPEAAFNQGLALERLGLPAAAADEYTLALALEADTDARAAIQKRLAGLVREAAPPLGDRALGAAQRQLDACLAQWAEGRRPELLEDTACVEARTTAATLGAQDRFLLEALDVARREIQQGDAARLETLAAGLRSFQAGVRGLNGDLLEQAELDLDVARKALAALRHPFALLAASLQAASLQMRSRHEQARPLLQQAVAEVAGRGYRRLEGQTWRRLGLAEQVLGNPGQALAAYERALGAFEACGDVTGLADTLSSIDEVYVTLGERLLAWKQRPALLAALARMDQQNERRHLVLDQLARSLRGEGLHRAALVFSFETLHAERGSHDPVSRAMARLGQGLAYLALGASDSAAAAVAAARKDYAELPDGDLLRRMSAEADLVEGRILARDEPHSAAAALDRALDFFREAATPNRMAEALFVRAQAELRAQSPDAAEATLEAAAQAVEQRSRGIAPRRLREAYLDDMRQVFAEMVALQARRDAALALQSAERGRARLLADWLPQDRAAPPGPSALAASLPEGTLLLEYVALPERTLLFAVARHGLRLVLLELKPAQLRGLVERARESLATGAGDESLRAAYTALLQPASGALADARRLVLVPDGVLHALPFAALVDPRTGKALLESHALQLAPSGAQYLEARARVLELGRSFAVGTLVVGNPSFDRARWPWLHDLPGAEAEARDVAKLYAGSRLLIGPQATRSALLAEVGTKAILHFAGHARLNEADPARSMLALAAESGPESGSLTAEDIAAQRWPNTRLVVLSTCSSGAGRLSGSGGSLSLARAFFAAGVPTVVASLWDVDDDATRRLMARFHAGLVRGLEPSAALRTAQLELRRTGDAASAATWAAFVVMGGEADSRRGSRKE